MQDGFVKQVGTIEPLFRRSSIIISPSLTEKILRATTTG
jgi:hypothetical protein